ncbi:response regulator [Candidatus Gottesmanbacteria bacterium]|nr:response regulator [Candidatus Gottesmanbacteria bacterium]
MIKLRQKKLLIVDEIDYPRLILEHFLVSAGYKVYSAQNELEAINRACSAFPDFILISIRSMDCVGLSALKALKNYFRLRSDLVQTSEPPIIILGSFENIEDIYTLKILGVSEVLLKPLNMQDLLNTIESFIKMDKDFILQKNKKILICDSEVRAQQFFKSILEDEILHIETVSNELEFIKKVRDEEFALCIINLSSLDSEIEDLLKTIKKTANHIYILTISDPNHKLSQDHIEHKEIQGHFTKPINIELFRNKIDNLLNPQTETEVKVENKVES